jgi:hypothetical protein
MLAQLRNQPLTRALQVTPRFGQGIHQGV